MAHYTSLPTTLTYTPAQGGEARRPRAVLPREVGADQVERGVVDEVAADAEEEAVGGEEVVGVGHGGREQQTRAAHDDADDGDLAVAEALEEPRGERRGGEHDAERQWPDPSCRKRKTRRLDLNREVLWWGIEGASAIKLSNDLTSNQHAI